MIEAKIVADSVGPNGIRLTTFVLTYPRMVHSEVMTHRMISRNASSSRAIPVKKQIQMVIDNPAIPLAFTKNQKGMQGGAAMEGAEHDAALAAWLEGRDSAVEVANKLEALGLHKQYANRVLEPWAHITVVATATDWDNFFALRIHAAAQPEIHALAKEMYAQYETNKPVQLYTGDWHLPFVSEEDKKRVYETPQAFEKRSLGNYSELFLKMSVARCARVSYLNHEGKSPTQEEDEQLYVRLVGSAPIHASPTEHQAMAIGDTGYYGNLRGWLQYRKTLKNENISKYIPQS